LHTLRFAQGIDSSLFTVLPDIPLAIKRAYSCGRLEFSKSASAASMASAV